MSKSNEQLYEKAMKAIQELFGDDSVSVEETIRQLRCLIDEIKMLVDSLEE